MEGDEGRWFVLGFGYDEVVDAWQDARFATALEQAWNAAQRPPEVDVRWMASADEYAFRWYINEAAAELLDVAEVTWRRFVVGRCDTVPDKAHPFLPQVLAGQV